MAVNLVTVCESLATAYNNAAAHLAALPAEDSFSEGGRSVSYQRAALIKHMADLRQEMQANGCSGAPDAIAVVTSRARA